MKRALVFSGGGAKGAYQMGVWKAIKVLNIKIDIVTGSSIGAFNGALFSQQEYLMAKKVWSKTTTKDLLDIDFDGKPTIKNYASLVKTIIQEGGFDFDKGQALLTRLIDEKRIRKSKIDYGLVTFSYKNKEPKMLSLDKIPEGKLIEYITASCTCFPAIRKKQIDDDVFIDGGYYDNLPINLAIDMGADEIIAVDLNSIGIKQKVKDKSVKVDIIKCRDFSPLTALTFDPEISKKRMLLGYIDTMKYFKKLDGSFYSFKKNELDHNYENIKDNYINLLKSILLSEKKNKVVREIFNISKYQKIFTNIKQEKSIKYLVDDSLEYLGKIFKIENDCIYKIDKYNKKILKEVKNLSYLEIGKNLKGKMLIGYIYNKYMNAKEEDKDKINKELFNIALIFQKEFLATIYLISLAKNHPLILKTDEIYQDILNALKTDKKK